MEYRNIKGTEHEPGMVAYRSFYDMATVEAVHQCRHVLGARFAVVILEDGRSFEAWDGFKYMVGTKS